MIQIGFWIKLDEQKFISLNSLSIFMENHFFIKIKNLIGGWLNERI